MHAEQQQQGRLDRDQENEEHPQKKAAAAGSSDESFLASQSTLIHQVQGASERRSRASNGLAYARAWCAGPVNENESGCARAVAVEDYMAVALAIRECIAATTGHGAAR